MQHYKHNMRVSLLNIFGVKCLGESAPCETVDSNNKLGFVIFECVNAATAHCNEAGTAAFESGHISIFRLNWIIVI